MAMWRDPLDVLISDLERVVPSADATIEDLPSMVEYAMCVQSILSRDPAERLRLPRIRALSACMITTNAWDAAGASQSHRASTAMAIAAKSDRKLISYNLRGGRPMVLWYSDPATLRGSDSATSGLCAGTVFARVVRYGTSAARPKQAHCGVRFSDRVAGDPGFATSAPLRSASGRCPARRHAESRVAPRHASVGQSTRCAGIAPPFPRRTARHHAARS